MNNAEKRQTERQAIVESVYAQHRAKQRKRNLLIYGGFGLLAVAIITVLAYVVTGSITQNNAAADAAKQPIADVKTYSDLTRNHVSAAVAYPQQPGVGGDHAQIWTNCAVYTQPVKEQQAVHSLEHGAVWISYQPGLPQADVATLTSLAKDKPYILLSPNPNQPEPVTVTAWGNQLALQEAGDARIPAFLKAFVQGPQTPEPGAACSGGVDG
ncbi:DUF3105 domain-containing protein [Arthrobacter sp. H14-L1]|uniref:DUF3105 domain-containing protein n=1 Tax=Arthrobacter sp. H14-L1 TaxID=2996697 RepID=UPI00227038F8|nr:DUF3105 domain-containing protein [Arthrobacter sp. H14-L1]MCY0906226.1 DUF3105 domain-containing protein [Arthrobacter sp. H14-L1]